MREILFRGKRVDGNEWVYGDLIQYKDLKSIRVYVPESFQRPSEFIVRPETIGQFTSRFTEDRRRIFEGDIVYVDDSGVGGMPHEMVGGTYKVVWNEIEAMFTLELLDGSNGICFDEVCVYSVLGNIHDNPELIKDART